MSKTLHNPIVKYSVYMPDSEYWDEYSQQYVNDNFVNYNFQIDGHLGSNAYVMAMHTAKRYKGIIYAIFENGAKKEVRNFSK